MLIYKIVTERAWIEAQAAGDYRGSADDIRDGYIHFSTAAQVQRTLGKHFARLTKPLLLLAIDAASLGTALRFEVSSGGAKYPHLYGAMPLDAVVSLQAIDRDEQGKLLTPLSGIDAS